MCGIPECFGNYCSVNNTCKYRCDHTNECKLDHALGESIEWNKVLIEAISEIDHEKELNEELFLVNLITTYLDNIKTLTKKRRE